MGVCNSNNILKEKNISIQEYFEKNNLEIDNNNKFNLENITDLIYSTILSIIIEQATKSVCKIVKGDEIIGTGFLCKIPFPDTFNFLPVFITCNHIIEENNIIKEKKLEIIFNNGEKVVIELYIIKEKNI